MYQKVRKFAAVVAVAGFAAACSDSTGGAEGDPLTATESEEIVSEALEVALAGLGAAFTGGFTSGPNLASPPVDFSVDVSDSCDLGGTVSVSGSLSGDIADNGTGNLRYEITERATNCVVETDSGLQVTVNTDPTLEMSGDYNITETSVDGSFGLSGRFTFTTDDGRTGACGVDMDVTLDVNLSTGASSGSASGSVCGNSVSESL